MAKHCSWLRPPDRSLCYDRNPHALTPPFFGLSPPWCASNAAWSPLELVLITWNWPNQAGVRRRSCVLRARCFPGAGVLACAAAAHSSLAHRRGAMRTRRRLESFEKRFLSRGDTDPCDWKGEAGGREEAEEGSWCLVCVDRWCLFHLPAPVCLSCSSSVRVNPLNGLREIKLDAEVERRCGGF